jgi:putative restriction endonuclease
LNTQVSKDAFLIHNYETTDVLTFYLSKITKLRIDRARGNPAPHKPLFLLAVIDLIEQGVILDKIEPSPQLDAVFEILDC